MSIVGLKMVRLALVDPKTQKLLKGADGLSTEGVIEVDSKMLGTRTANISNLEGQATKIPGNNSVQDVIQQSLLTLTTLTLKSNKKCLVSNQTARVVM